MRIGCPTCKSTIDLDANCAGQLIRCRACGRSFVAPSELTVTGQRHTLSQFSIVGLLLLHFLTMGVYSVIHLGLMHDRLPKIRKSDPSGFVSVALSMVPFVNLVWLFFSLRRLCVRLNEQRRFAGLPEDVPQTLAVVVATLLTCGTVATILPITGWVVLGATLSVLAPVFLATVQASVNELVALEDSSQPETASHGANEPAASAGLSNRDLGEAGERRDLAGTTGS